MKVKQTLIKRRTNKLMSDKTDFNVTSIERYQILHFIRIKGTNHPDNTILILIYLITCLLKYKAKFTSTNRKNRKIHNHSWRF